MTTVEFTVKTGKNLWGDVDYSHPERAYLIASEGETVELDTSTVEYTQCVSFGLGEYTGDLPPSGDFTADVTSGATPLTVNFTSELINVETYEWSFGDLGTSTDANPTYIYVVPGTYTVTLTGHNGLEDAIFQKVDYITVTA